MDELLSLVREVVDPAISVAADTPLLTTGLVDSLGVVVLLTEIESRYGVTIEPEEVDASSFDTPAQMLARIQRGAPA
jgi:D-alanine--poly(phosphoribitol) ligase subunit 2